MAPAAAQDRQSARDAFVKAAEAGDRAAMKALIAPPVTSMGGTEYDVDQFLGLIEGCSHSLTAGALISWRCERGVIVTAALKDGPGRVSLRAVSSIRQSVAVPAPIASGPTALVTAAIERGDVPALTSLTRGSIYSKLTAAARSGEIVRMTPANLIEITRGCAPDRPVEPLPSVRQYEDGRGTVSFRCRDRAVAGTKCQDVGYGLFVQPMGDYHRLEVWEDDYRSTARCGTFVPPPPPPPPSPLPRPN
jgi:hypothetical protein